MDPKFAQNQTFSENHRHFFPARTAFFSNPQAPGKPSDLPIHLASNGDRPVDRKDSQKVAVGAAGPLSKQILTRIN